MKVFSPIFALVLTISAAPVFAASNGIHDKVVGGVEASRGEFPFIVSLQENGMGHFCGGSLIRKNWVLTAAHCVEGGTVNKVVIGLHELKNTQGAETIKPKRIVRHPQYSEGTSDYDFALIELSQDSKFQPVQLNTTEIDIPTSGPSIVATVAGWGLTTENSFALPSRLQKVDVPLVPAAVCNADYKGAITDRMICAGVEQGGKDSCQGDSGGPLTALADNNQRYLIGVVSWGEGCARAGLPGVYAKVSSQAAWIAQTIQ